MKPAVRPDILDNQRQRPADVAPFRFKPARLVFARRTQGEAVLPVNLPERGNVKLLLRHSTLAVRHQRADIGMSFTKGVVDFVDDTAQLAFRAVAKPERDRSKAYAQHARKGDKTDGAAIEPYTGLGIARLGPEAERNDSAARAVIGFAEGNRPATIDGE